MKYLFLLLFIVVFPVPAMAEINTLEDALALAYQHDPGLEAERAKLRATDEQMSQALSNYRPSIDATAEGGKNRQDIANGGFFSGSDTLTPRDAGVNITQPVFRGFRTEGSVDSAESNVNAGRASLQDAEQQLLFDTAKAYLDVVQAQDLVQINLNNESDLKQQLNITKERFAIGELRKTDVDQAQSRLKTAEVGRLQAETDLANKRVTFARLAGEMPGILTPPKLALDQPKTLDEAVAMAERDNPAVMAALYTYDAANSDVTVAEGSLLPEVNVVGSAVRSKDEDPTIPQRQDTFSILAKVSIPLYRSGSDYSKTRAAKETVSQRDMELQNALNKARETASTTWQTLVTAQASIVGDKAALDATDQALYGVKEEAKVGTRTTLDVLNAEQELLTARTDLVKAIHDEAMAVLQVKAVIGELTAQALHLPVKLYDPAVHYDKARNQWVGLDIKE